MSEVRGLRVQQVDLQLKFVCTKKDKRNQCSDKNAAVGFFWKTYSDYSEDTVLLHLKDIVSRCKDIDQVYMAMKAYVPYVDKNSDKVTAFHASTIVVMENAYGAKESMEFKKSVFIS